MDLLFKREQSSDGAGRVKFRLWGKIELNEDEQEIVKRYRFDDAVLIEVIEPRLARRCLYIGIGVFVLVAPIVGGFAGYTVGALAGGGVAYWYFTDKRETVYVSDLLHGRHFTCDGVVELARKEEWLRIITSFLRQVMESAKHWDGTERHAIEPLPKDEARRFIIQGL